jgi:hypothetical protein
MPFRHPVLKIHVAEQCSRPAVRPAHFASRPPDSAARLAQLDTKLAQAENADFSERLGRMKVQEMTLREKSELVTRLGFRGFMELLGVR